MQQDSAFDVPVRAPSLSLRCSGVATTMADLRGHAVHAVTTKAENVEVPPQSGISTVTLDLRDSAAPGPGACAVADPAAWNAYAVLADLPPNQLTGTEFLVNPNGWFRAVHRQGATGGWQSRDNLIAAIHGICTSPIRAPSGDEHEHHH